ncbi:retinol dehydrogenase 14 isoform X1 [Culex quinquefasciatus]|uniref:retinol dehydrogenase 14 isoform X1 n=1 Tax=Culex quinquefasciatus TaxID=7176 RepID=UPI0018E347FA|nr:retinol dehydrogenase 14 isoform X1 [Culex quinquefasciatus]XP_038112521.1 retinol dehydrogenase 14 isoform X1 [Culex quinquefasciatus]XP_038112522.1 retinol dehydrogenase 14 isoform X1 [Culex quinquefasciatus]XP_038112523.1 retinol dehydrogenase 14 isoform X1 [Culex quinquefasciatus]
MSLLDWDSPLSIVAFAVTTVAVLLSLVKYYLYVTCGKLTTSRNMEGKTVIITGANSGIGKETARDLAKRGARVIMACRNMETAKEAQEEIMGETNNNNLILKNIDVSSLASIRKFAQDIIATEPVIDVMIHNAGVAQGFNNKSTSDNLEFTMATNCFGPFLLSHLLIDLIKKSDQGRIIFVSSKLYRLGYIRRDLSNLNPLKYFSLFPVQLYNQSKFVEIMYTQEMARRLAGTRITVNALHPGVVDTGIWRNVPFPLSIPFKPIQMCFRTPKEGARCTVYATITPELETVSGKYFRGCKIEELHSRVENKEIQQKVWEKTCELVRLTPEDPKI